jgi:Eukaryotic aspartyl protease
MALWVRRLESRDRDSIALPMLISSPVSYEYRVLIGMDMTTSAFWYQMFDANMIDTKAFSLCFSRQVEAEESGTEAGAMSLGGADTRLHETPLVYSTTSESSSGFFVVHITKMYLRAGGGGLSALSKDPSLKVIQLNVSEYDLNSGEVIVDSGTTDTYFPSSIRSEFSMVFRQLTGQVYDHSLSQFTAEELADQPTILFQLRGNAELNKAIVDANGSNGVVVGLAGELDPDNPYDVILAMPPEHYYEYDPESQGYTAYFYVDESSGGVLGANAMIGHDVYFDVGNLRIGWAESTCNYTKLVSDYSDGYGPSQSNGNVPSQSSSYAPSQIGIFAPSQSSSKAPSQSSGPPQNQTEHASDRQSDAGSKSPFSGSHWHRQPPIEFLSLLMILAIVAQ